MKTKTSKPCCVFCGATGSGAQFTIFNPRFQPFGTACVECEAKLPAGTKLPGVLPGILPVLVPELSAPSVLRESSAYRIGWQAALNDAGMSIDDCDDSIVPACCSEGCQVEPDGKCEHGFPSVLLALGVI